MRIAIDTNVLIAALTQPTGTSARIVTAWLEGRVEVLASEATIREAELVLGGGWLGRMVPLGEVESLLEALRTRTLLVERPPPIDDLSLKDAGDLCLVEAAVAGGARYVVTTDREFLRQRGYADVEFVTPQELLRKIETVGAKARAITKVVAMAFRRTVDSEEDGCDPGTRLV